MSILKQPLGMSDHYSNYTNKDKNTLAQYRSSSYNLNNDLWHQHKDNRPLAPDIAERHSAMSDAVNRHETHTDMVVHSGLRANNYRGKPGDVFHHPAYLSTSLDPAVAKAFANPFMKDGSDESERHILRINVPKGTKGAYIGHFNHTLSRGEKEFILPAGTNLKHEKTETTKSSNGLDITHIHHMSIVSDKLNEIFDKPLTVDNHDDVFGKARSFRTSPKNKYRVLMNTQANGKTYIWFKHNGGVVHHPGEDRKGFHKAMATIHHIVKKHLEDNPHIKGIEFSGDKSEKSRDKLYTAILNKFATKHTKKYDTGDYNYSVDRKDIKGLKEEWWHGSASGDLRGGVSGLHLGTKLAAKQALEARIGIPAHGRGWDGSSKYGETLLAGHKTRMKMDPKGYLNTGFNVKTPDEDFYPSEHFSKNPEAHPRYPNGEKMPLDVVPNIRKYIITGKMTNSTSNPHSDERANGMMRGQLKKGNAKKGYYYKNTGEDSGSVSAVVPNGSFVKLREIFDKPIKNIDKYNHTKHDKSVDHHFSFNTDKDNHYLLNISSTDDPSKKEVWFKHNGRVSAKNMSDPKFHRAMSTIHHIVKQHLKDHPEVEGIKFTGDNDAKGRLKLYGALAKKYTNKYRRTDYSLSSGAKASIFNIDRKDIKDV